MKYYYWYFPYGGKYTMFRSTGTKHNRNGFDDRYLDKDGVWKNFDHSRTQDFLAKTPREAIQKIKKVEPRVQVNDWHR
jgi:hypothetical protein